MNESHLSKLRLLFSRNPKLHVSVMIALLFIIVSNMRPAIIGQKMGLLIIPVVVYFVLAAIIWKSSIPLRRIKNPFLYTYILIVFYLFFQMLLVGVESEVGALSVLAMLFFGYIPFILGDIVAARKISKILVGICVVLGMSYIVTMGLAVFGSYIYLFSVDLPTHTDWVYQLQIMFPFSPVYDSGAKVGSLVFPRAIGFMREPGLYQMVLIISFWMVDIYQFRYSRWLKFFLIISLIFTFSTAGYVLFLVTIGLRYFVKSRRKALFFLIGLPVIMGIFYFLLTTQSQFGLIQKFHNRSGLSRLEVTLKAIDLIATHPLMGIGFHNRIQGMQLGINFLGTTAQIGILGVAVFLFPFFYVWTKIKSLDIAYFCIWLTLLTTMLFSQPLYDKPITYLILSFLMISTSNQSKKQSLDAA
jgi:hypothetical protein